MEMAKVKKIQPKPLMSALGFSILMVRSLPHFIIFLSLTS
jgi:hypothetical protein